MATKKPFPFAGKESKKEEAMELKKGGKQAPPAKRKVAVMRKGKC